MIARVIGSVECSTLCGTTEHRTLFHGLALLCAGLQASGWNAAGKEWAVVRPPIKVYWDVRAADRSESIFEHRLQRGTAKGL
eukprot:COSAG04_NODE_24623_length_319_cov_0.709091_1_plen_81_part_10